MTFLFIDLLTSLLAGKTAYLTDKQTGLVDLMAILTYKLDRDRFDC